MGVALHLLPDDIEFRELRKRMTISLATHNFRGQLIISQNST